MTRNLRRVGAAFLVVLSTVMASTVLFVDACAAQALKERHLGTSRDRAANSPRSERDQAVVDGWPLYRTERGQTAFNEAMATLKATEGTAPQAAAFKACSGLMCALKLPQVDSDGWLPAGRLWLSPTQYVLIAKSPRPRASGRRSVMGMKVFVLHEFHNSSRNTDMYDTISSHSGAVFVPLYMGKTMLDAQGRSFVVVVQVAPLDVVSVHATNMGSAGPGMEVAKNTGDALEPMQGLAGIVVSAMVKAHIPRLNVVNHRGSEGQPMLQAYQQWVSLAANGRAPVMLPFVAAAPQRIAQATGRLDDLITRGGASARIAVAQRSFLPQRPSASDIALPTLATGFAPALVELPHAVSRPMGLGAGAPPVEQVRTRAWRPWFRSSDATTEGAGK